MYTEDFTSDTHSRERTYPYGTSNTLRARREDPYGFIRFSLEKGQLPEALDNRAFTTWEEAEKALNAFLETRKTPVK